MNKVFNAILGVSAAVVVASAMITPANVSAWGDSANGRPVYTLEQINAGVLGNGITFNSITNGKIGDERNFVGAKTGSATQWNEDTIAVKDGETYTIRLYVHNNSPLGKNAIAKGVTASISLPTTVSTSHTVIGYLDSSNATPTRYWDEVTLTSSDEFYIEYVSGSAKYTNTQGTFALDDSVITSGATLGYTSMNGEIPGCYEYDGQVTIQVKVHSSVSNRISKTVRIKGSGNEFTESVNAKVGDEVEFQIEYKNLSDQKVDDVIIRDILPTNMEYVQNSTYVYNSNHKEGVLINENTVTTTGINIGSYNARGNAYVRFTAKVVNKSLACGSNQLVNWANATVNTKVVKDDASVMVTVSGCTPTPTPTPTPDPVVIVNTGAGEIVGSAVGAGRIITAAGYFIASRKKLMK